MSGNPFRRIPADNNNEVSNSSIVPATPPARTKPKKVVRITSPPRSPVSSPGQGDPFDYGLDTALNREDTLQSPPPPQEHHGMIGEQYGDAQRIGGQGQYNALLSGIPSEQVAAFPAYAEPVAPRQNQAPPNPFSRTLATIESSGSTSIAGDDTSAAKQGTGTGRGPLDVDSFTRLLMTGSAGPRTDPADTIMSQKYTPSSSSTDASSTSRHSMYGLSHEAVSESPRTSLDRTGSEDDDEEHDEHSSLMGMKERRKEKPPPPQHRHGKPFSQKGPQTVSFDDFSASAAGTYPPEESQPSTPSTPASVNRLGPQSPRSPSDLNKPLPPPPPASTSPDLGPVVPEKDGAVSPPVQTSPVAQNSEQPKKVPPPPPVTRRHSQLRPAGHAPTRNRSNSALSQSSVSKESTEERLPPVPPLARRSGSGNPSGDVSTDVASIRSEQSTAVESASNQNAPPPPPPRGVGKGQGSLKRTPSAQSTSSLTQRRVSPGLGQAPPPPPPRRSESKRASFDGTRLGPTLEDSTSAGTESRRSSADTRRASGQSFASLQQVPESEGGGRGDGEGMGTGTGTGEGLGKARTKSDDILGDLDAFQREIDELRARAMRRAS